MDCAYYEVIVPGLKLKLWDLECTLDGKKMAVSEEKCSRKQRDIFGPCESTVGCDICVKRKEDETESGEEYGSKISISIILCVNRSRGSRQILSPG